MNSYRLLRRLFTAAVWSMALGVLPAHAQTYPSRPIRIVVPAGPGAAADLVPRLIAAKLTERLGWTIVVENRPGGNFLIGTRAVAQSEPDGYTLLAAVGTLAILPSVDKNIGIDFLKELAPITRTVDLQLVVIANPSLPAGTLSELATYAKANPGKLSYATAGTGSSTHLAFELFKQLAGVDIVTIPYKDGSFAPDVASGVVPLGITSVSAAAPLVAAGKVKALGILGLKRSPILPNVSTVSEVGLPEMDADPWLGLMARAGTPPEIVARLNREVVAVLQLPDVRDQLLKLGAVPAGESPEQFRQKFAGDMARWAKVIKAANIKIE